jgi:hypothetical protein
MATIAVEVGRDLVVDRRSIEDELSARLLEDLRVVNAARVEAQRQSRWGWEQLPEYVELGKQERDVLRLPRGYVLRFKRRLRDAGHDVTWEDRTVWRTGAPLGALRHPPKPSQPPMIAAMIGHRQGFMQARTGAGKEAPVSEPVLTPEGWRCMGDLRVGDLVIGSDGDPTAVTGVFPQGTKPVWRLNFSDGSYARCGREHLWAVRTKGQKCVGKGYQVLTTEDVASSVARQWQIPVVAPVQHPERDLPIEPYQLGVMLGDGSLSGRTCHCVHR